MIVKLIVVILPNVVPCMRMYVRSVSVSMPVSFKRNAHPCFPGVPPPAVILEKVILKYDTEEKDEVVEVALCVISLTDKFRKKRNRNIFCHRLFLSLVVCLSVINCVSDRLYFLVLKYIIDKKT